MVGSLLPTLPIRTLHDNIFDLDGHREAGVDFEPAGTGPSGVARSTVDTLCAVHLDFEAVAECTEDIVTVIRLREL